MTVEISVVIPMYNNEDTITDQLDALRRCLDTAPPTELIVVNNRSTDRSAEIVRMWSQERGIDVRIVAADERAGEPYARNVGLAASQGQFVLYCDGDDRVEPTWIASMYDGLQQWPYVTGPVLVDELNEPWASETRGSAMFDGMQKLYDTIPFAHGCNMGFQRESLRNLGGFDESFLAGCDQEVAIRAWEHDVQLGFQPEAKVQYRLRTDLGSMYRQGRSYGRYRVKVRRLKPELVDRRVLRNAMLRRVFWLVRRAPAALFSQPLKARWVWVASQVVGEAQGSLESRRGP